MHIQHVHVAVHANNLTQKMIRLIADFSLIQMSFVTRYFLVTHYTHTNQVGTAAGNARHLCKFFYTTNFPLPLPASMPATSFIELHLSLLRNISLLIYDQSKSTAWHLCKAVNRYNLVWLTIMNLQIWLQSCNIRLQSGFCKVMKTRTWPTLTCNTLNTM